MDMDFSEVQLDNADGNCVIVTTLMSSTASALMTPPKSTQSFWKTAIPSPILATSGWSMPLPPGPMQESISQLDDCGGVIYLTDEKNSKLIGKGNANVPPNEIVNTNAHAGSYGFGPLGTGGHALLSLDPNSIRETCVMKRSTRLGPLVVARRSRDMCGVRRGSPPISEVEQLSYRRALERVCGQLKRTEAALAESHAAAELAARTQAESLESTRCAVERRLRQEFHEALAAIRAENDELTARAKAQESRAATAVALARDAAQSELASRLDACERQWSERLRSAEAQWEARVETVSREKQEALRHVQDLAHTVGELEAALRERTWAEQELDTLAAQQQHQQQRQLQTSGGVRGDERAELEKEILTLRASLRDAEVREQALLLQLESAGDEAAVETKALERQLRQVRHELEAERANCEEVVKVFGDQVESMSTQLNVSMQRNALLTEQLAKFHGAARIH